MYEDRDGDGYGNNDIQECLCQNGTNASVDLNGTDYIIFAGDCYDADSTIKPLSCKDGIDNDDDGTVDAMDPDCFNGLKEDGSTPEVEMEILDGHDNDCDGYVAAIEMDCDDDGTFPLLPAESFGYNTDDPFIVLQTLVSKHVQEMSPISLVGEKLEKLVCDDITADVRVDASGDGEIEYNGTGLWLFNIAESDDGFDGRYDGGRRLWSNPVCSRGGGDCDDQCSARCPGQSEGCDGIDNDCSDTVPGSDNDGIPDSLDPDARIFGSISPAEIDIDSDGFLSCDDFATNRTETQFTDFSCGESYDEEADVNDCSNLCFFSAPGGEERCDGFLGVCEGEYLDGTDDDRDDHTTCGAWSTPDGKVLKEDVYVVVWLKDIDWSQLGSEEVG